MRVRGSFADTRRDLVLSEPDQLSQMSVEVRGNNRAHLEIVDVIMAGSFTIRQFKNDFSAMLATQREQHDLQSAFLSAGTTKSSFVAAENHFSGFLAKDNE
jgi:hypothetical protein